MPWHEHRGHYLAAYHRGVQAFKHREPVTDCPYRDVRGNAGHVTFSRAYRNAWIAGWEDARKGKTELPGSSVGGSAS